MSRFEITCVGTQKIDVGGVVFPVSCRKMNSRIRALNLPRLARRQVKDCKHRRMCIIRMSVYDIARFKLGIFLLRAGSVIVCVYWY